MSIRASATADRALTTATPRPRPPAGGLWHNAWRRFLRDRPSIIALAVLGLIALSAVGAPWLSDHVLHTDPARLVRRPDGRIATLQQPGPGYLLGTDELGRDTLTRLLYAGQVSLLVGVLVSAISLGIGAPLGILAGYFGGRVDDVVNACVLVVLNTPTLFLFIVLSVFFQPSVWQLALIFGFFFWPGTARQVRASVLSLRTRDFVEAVRVLGAGDRRIMVRHVFPNVASVMLVVAGVDMAAAILAESALSFLGFGVPVPLSSWGNMLTGSMDQFRSAPWLVYPPGLMIFLTVLCVYLVTDGIRDALDPRG
ncbi:MAG: ABC transporter permease [Chloroflexi bacterium]|nr:ABC transporter permease [Chloroflexota bacterium]